MIWSILVASCWIEAAKTSRPKWHHRIAPMHIGQGSPEVAPERQHPAVAHDGGPERKIGMARLGDGDPHEFFVGGGGRRCRRRCANDRRGGPGRNPGEE